jgi:uncharacterized protein YukE
MSKIRVIPSLLLEAANELQRIISEVEAVGDQVQTAASRAPSYEGQFGPKVHSLRSEAIASSRKLAQDLSTLANVLRNKGEDFESADLAGAEGLAGILAKFEAWLSSDRLLALDEFPIDFVSGILILGTLLRPRGGRPPDEESEWEPPKWAPLIVGIGEGWDQATTSAQQLSFLGLYGLYRATQAADDVLDIAKETPGLAIDAAWYGFPSSGGLPSGLSGQIWMAGYTEADLLDLHQWQYDGTESTPNDCATTSMSVVINQALITLGYPGEPAQHGEMALILDSAPEQIFRIYRFPASTPTIRINMTALGNIVVEPKGAMPPSGAVAALNQLADEMRGAGIPSAWTAVASGNNNVGDLIDNLQNGRPTIIFGVWEDGTPHAMVLAGYDADMDTWKILDPGTRPDRITGVPRFREMDTQQLETWWGSRYFAYQRDTMVTFNLDH